jgi:hypothetical protein
MQTETPSDVASVPSASAMATCSSNGEFSSFDCPGATFTGAAGITPDGDIVGRCTISGVSHAFLLKRGQQPRATK